MLRESSASGLCRRLNRSERLRSASGVDYMQKRGKKMKETKPKEQKPIEFALLRCFDDEERPSFETFWRSDEDVLFAAMMIHEESD